MRHVYTHILSVGCAGEDVMEEVGMAGEEEGARTSSLEVCKLVGQASRETQWLGPWGL